MGCISCKAIREEVVVSHGFGGNSAAWDQLLSSNDNLFALLCSSRTTSFTLPSEDGKAGSATRFTRSKSCQTSEIINGDKNAIGSRSFHTVEEYDAFLERIHKASAESFEDYYSSNSVQESGVRKKPSIEVEDDMNSVGSPENGWKRKAVGRGLKSLDVEFPRLKQQFHDDGQLHSYVTPKFGSYNADASATHEKAAMFSPELVAAFEDRMMELQVEEDSILRELDGYFMGGNESSFVRDQI